MSFICMNPTELAKTSLFFKFMYLCTVLARCALNCIISIDCNLATDVIPAPCLYVQTSPL